LFGEMVTTARVSAGDRRADGVGPELIASVGRHEHRAAPGHLNRHLVIEVERDRQNDFIARLRDGEDGVDERHVGARRHHDAAAARDVDAVFVAKLRREALDERRQPLAPLDIRAFAGRSTPRARRRWPPAAGRNEQPPVRAKSCQEPGGSYRRRPPQ